MARPINTAAFAFGVAAMLIGGCAKNRPPGALIRKVEVEGVESVDEKDLVEHLNLQPVSILRPGEKYYYLPGMEEIDEQRIRDYYAARGHYDAEVRSIHVEVERKGNEKRRLRRAKRRRARGKKPRPPRDVARVQIAVEEGPATKVRQRSFEWKTALAPEIRRDIEAEVDLAVGDRFELGRLRAAAQALRQELRSRGYAHAEVEQRARVDRADLWADVEFVIEPKQRVRIRELTLSGTELVPADLVMREISMAEGELYSPKLADATEKRVYDMGVFDAVSVSTGPERGDGTVVLEVEVRESKLQSLAAGVGIGVDPIRWDQHGILRYRHQSIFGRLTAMDLRLQAGYAELPNFWAPVQHGPVVDLDLGFRKKGIGERFLIWTTKPGFELGIWEGYQFWNITNGIGVSRWFSRFFELSLSYNNKYEQLFNLVPALRSQENQQRLGADFRERYFLSFVQAEAKLHLTDRYVDPRNGALLIVTYDLANRFLASQFNYHQFAPELRAYYSPHERVRAAIRGRLGLIFPYGDQRFAGAPLDHRRYLGGPNTVRGWGSRRLSPRVEQCDVNLSGEFVDCRPVPVGGLSEVLLNAEVSVRTVADLWVASFVDVGDVREGVTEFRVKGWQVSSGGGLRYNSPIGILRLDFGYRITPTPERFQEPRRWAFHFSLGQAF